MRSLLKRYLKNSGGHFAVSFALLGIPLVVATTFVVDYSMASTEKVNVKTSLDAAVIAAVNNNTLSPSQKEAYAETHFNENYNGPIDVKLNSKASVGRVEMTASGLSPVTVAETLGIDGIEIFESSAAEQTSENVICALSLATEGMDAISFGGNSTFSAPTCSVHANSSDSNAIRVVDDASALAKNFCAVGGGTGQFQPYVKGDCAAVNDPYKHISAPAAGICKNEGNIRDIRQMILDREAQIDGAASSLLDRFGGNPGNGAGTARFLASFFENTTGSNTTLQPGTYCGGLTVDGTNVRFAPGNHIMLGGPLIFRNDAQAVGDEVTFVMKGLPSVLSIESGANVSISAPSSGELAGLAFFQDVDTQLGTDGIFPNGINLLSSGGELNVTGTVYFPTQSVYVVSDSVFGAQAPATSFIAYDLKFAGNSDIRVAVDHQRAGLPPIMPRTEDGARLVQ